MRHYSIALSDRAKVGLKAYAVVTQMKRAPLKGEWYISGAIPEAYQAPNDFPEDSVYWIAKVFNSKD